MADLKLALEWARQNPNDERSKKLLEAVASGKITSDAVQAKSIQQEHENGATQGIWDAIKKGFVNAKDQALQAGSEAVAAADSNANPFVKLAKASTSSMKAVLNPLTELAVATPLRVAGEVAQNVTGIDVNEAVSKGTQALVQKGMDTETAKKAMEGWKKLQETDPESAMALSSVMDIGNIASNAVGLKGAGMAGDVAENMAKQGISSAGKTAMKVADKAGDVAGYGVRQATGLSRDTISQIVKNPEFFTTKEMNLINKEAIVNKVKNAVEKRLTSLSETGKEYELIRKSGEKVQIPDGTIQGILGKYGIGVDDAGKLVTTAESVPLGSGDISAIEGFIKQYGSNPELSGNAFMNARKALSNMAKFDSTKTDIAQRISKDLRKEFDTLGKNSLTGLAELDAKYAPEIKLLGGLKKELFDVDGTLKQGAIQKIANLTGSGKEKLLAKIENIVPGITTDVNILKALKDIEAVNNQKVGAYVSSAIKSGLAGGVISGGNPMVAIGAAIASSPQVAIPLIRNYAKLKNISSSIIENMIGKMKSGKKLVENEIQIANDAVDSAAKKAGSRIANIKPGLSIEDVKLGKPGYNNPLIQEAKKYNSAEEFVKAQGDTLYHGSKQKYDKFDLSKADKGGLYGNSAYMTPDAKRASSYGENVTEYVVPKNAKLLKEADFEKRVSSIVPSVPYGDITVARKKAVEQLINEGYDGVKAGNTTAIFNQKALQTKQQLIDIWNQANGKK